MKWTVQRLSFDCPCRRPAGSSGRQLDEDFECNANEGAWYEGVLHREVWAPGLELAGAAGAGWSWLELPGAAGAGVVVKAAALITASFIVVVALLPDSA